MRRGPYRSILSLAVILIATTFAVRAADPDSGEEQREQSATPAPQEHAEIAPDPDFYWGGYWGAPMWYDPLWYGPPWYGPPYYYPPYAPPVPRNGSALVVVAHPRKADVYLDGTLRGRAKDFDSEWHPLFVKPGEHEVRLAYHGYQTLKLELDTGRGMSYTLHERLHKGEGIDPRSSETAAVHRSGPEGNG